MKNILVPIVIGVWILGCSGQTENTADDRTETNSDAYIIAYNVYAPDSLKEDNYEIFTMAMDGSDRKNITTNPDVAWTYLAWNDKIFFISDRDTSQRHMFLYEMSGKGENIRRITNFRLKDSWMDITSDGSRLLVTPHPGIDSLFYMIDRQGNILRKITHGTPYATDPAFSPDDQWIAYVGQSKRSKREDGYEEEICVSKLDGSDFRKLTTYPEADTTAPWYAYKAGPPKWHPSGEFISYQSYQKGKYSLYAVTPDGSRHWKLTDLAWNEGYHEWSPDGKLLAIEVFDKDETQFMIGLMDWETKEMNILTDSSYKFQQCPVFVKQR